MAKRHKPRYVWAVNYATETDWECLRDDGYDSVEQIASVTCLPQLYSTPGAALNAGEAAWRADEQVAMEEEGIDAAMLARLTRAKPEGKGVRVLKDGEQFVVMICARKLTLPA